jgi:glycosyltransferase involved in cell wall biosynthesis
MNKYLYAGALPWEHDGGAVVNHYLLNKQNELRPRDEYWGIPKVWDEVEPSAIPFVNIPMKETVSTWKDVAQLMFDHEIPLVNTFHLSREENVELLDHVHMIGSKIVLHQTIHWRDDDIMKTDRLPDMDMIVAPTEYAQSVFIQDAKVPRKKTCVIPHAVDTEKFVRAEGQVRQSRKAELGVRPEQKVIIYSGRLGLWKGIREVIPVVRSLVREYDCVFIFRGSQFGDNEGLALDYILRKMDKNSTNVIYIPDWKSTEYMEWIYSFSDILIFNSGHEGFGVPLIEIQSVGGCPVTTALANHVEICGNDGMVGKIISPTVDVGEVNDGTRVKVGSTDGVYGAIKWLLENPIEMEIMGKRGMKRTKEKYNLTDICKQWLSLYDLMIPDGYDMMKEALDDK